MHYTIIQQMRILIRDTRTTEPEDSGVRDAAQPATE